MPPKKRRPLALAECIVDLDAPTEWLKIFLYGPPKVGKTVFGGSASVCEEASPVLLCDIEGGRVSLRDAPADIVNKKRLRVLEISRFKQFNELYEFLAANPGKFKTLVFDSISEIHVMAMESAMNDVVRRDPTREEFVPSMREYGIVRAQLRKLIREFRALPLNLIITSMLRIDEDPTTGALLRSPQLPGQLRMEIPGYCDVVALMDIEKPRKKRGEPEKEVQRVLHLKEVSRAVVGTRGWGYPQRLINPKFEDVRNAILGGNNDSN